MGDGLSQFALPEFPEVLDNVLVYLERIKTVESWTYDSPEEREILFRWIAAKTYMEDVLKLIHQIANKEKIQKVVGGREREICQLVEDSYPDIGDQYTIIKSLWLNGMDISKIPGTNDAQRRVWIDYFYIMFDRNGVDWPCVSRTGAAFEEFVEKEVAYREREGSPVNRPILGAILDISQRFQIPLKEKDRLEDLWKSAMGEPEN